MEIYKCEICNYTTNIKSNLTRHIKGKHTEKVEPIDDKQREIDRLKAEIETLKANHKLELMELKISIYENQIIKPSRKSISPAKPEIELPKPSVIPKKPHNMSPLEYLNKYFPPHEQNMLDETIIEKLHWQDIKLSMSNLEQQYISIVKPIIKEYKLVYHSGEKNHSLKFYYVDVNYEWKEDLNDLEYLFYIVWQFKIKTALNESFKTNEFNADEQMELSAHYSQKQNNNYIVKQLLDVMKLPE